MERVPTSSPPTPMQLVIAVMVGLNYDHATIAKELNIGVPTVRDHLARLARRIPGDLPATARVIAWVRGASLDMLEGRTLRFEIMRDGIQAKKMLSDLERSIRAAQDAQPAQASNATRTKL